METKEKSITKMCSFYANEWHLTTMILPYITKMIQNGYEIDTILENDIEENMKELTTKLNIDTDIKEKILKINWKSNENNKIKPINNSKHIILVEGNMKKIKEVNEYLEINSINNMSIINCFHVGQIENNISEILNTHDLILNTSGNHKINECLNP